MERKYITVDNQEFRIGIDPRTNATEISSIHPYDETEYHWAYKGEDKKWKVCRARRWVYTLNGSLTEEEVAKELLRLDNEAGLKRTGGIW